MLNKNNSLILGIAGASGAGKDLLCSYIGNIFSKRYNIDCVRKSIAGDLIKKDLNLLMGSHKVNFFTENRKEKEILRPQMIDYGIQMRNKSSGRYFIEQFQEEKKKLNIVPDIRFAEYEKDEHYWLKTEKKGILVFLERIGKKNNNINEEKNNPILKKYADYVLEWDDIIGIPGGEEKAMVKVNSLCDFLHKKFCITTFQ